MKVEGGCYCRSVRYQAEGEPMFKGECFCRECQYISGGSSNLVMGMPQSGFSFTKGKPNSYSRADLENPVTREFCPNCGTHLLTKVQGLPDTVLIKVGTLDDPSVFEGPQMVIFTCDKQQYHNLPENVPAFERGPG